MKYLYIISLLLLAGCRSVQPGVIEYRDSIQYRESIAYVSDTVYIELPPQFAERTTRDSLSYLESAYAMSTARVYPDGTLFHDLRTKPQRLSAIRPQEVRYITRTHAREIRRPQYVERSLSRWERFRLDWFTRLLAVLLLWLLWTYRKSALRLLRMLIGYL